MANPEHVEIVQQGAEAIAKWREEDADVRLDLRSADLRSAHLSHVNLSEANLSHANLSRANLIGANLSGANLIGANLSGAYLICANLSGAELSGANLSGAELSGANLSRANLSHANLSRANLNDAELAESHFGDTHLADVDLSVAKGLSDIRHGGPSHIDNATLSRCGWKLPVEFLRGCGFAPWEVLAAKYYDPNLTPVKVADLQQEIFNERTAGFKVGAVFVSYSRKDGDVVERLRSRLFDEGLHAWVDVHDATSGPFQRMVHDAIDRSDVVLLVLSENSVDSKWVKHEMKRAHDRELEGKRNLLCPIALDDSWKSKMDDINWQHLDENNILDFSEWEEDERFDAQFRKMLDGMKLYYGPKGE